MKQYLRLQAPLYPKRVLFWANFKKATISASDVTSATKSGHSGLCTSLRHLERCGAVTRTTPSESTAAALRIIHDVMMNLLEEGVCVHGTPRRVEWSGKYSRKMVFTFENLMVSEAVGDCVLCSVGGCGVVQGAAPGPGRAALCGADGRGHGPWGAGLTPRPGPGQCHSCGRQKTSKANTN